jgi:hypothetical protein
MAKIDLSLLEEDLLDETELFVPGGKLSPDPKPKTMVRKSYSELNKKGRRDRREGTKGRLDQEGTIWPV